MLRISLGSTSGNWLRCRHVYVFKAQLSVAPNGIRCFLKMTFFKLHLNSSTDSRDISGTWTQTRNTPACRRWVRRTYILRLEDVTDHLVLLLGFRCTRCGFDAVLWGRSRHPPPRHQDHDVPDVGDVGDGAQRVVHHGFLLAYPEYCQFPAHQAQRERIILFIFIFHTRAVISVNIKTIRKDMATMHTKIKYNIRTERWEISMMITQIWKKYPVTHNFLQV